METDSETMLENVEALLQQLARLTDALNGSAAEQQKTGMKLLETQGEQLQKFIAEQKKLVDTQHNVNQNQGTGNARLDKFTANKQQDVGSWFDTLIVLLCLTIRLMNTRSPPCLCSWMAVRKRSTLGCCRKQRQIISRLPMHFARDFVQKY